MKTLYSFFNPHDAVDQRLRVILKKGVLHGSERQKKLRNLDAITFYLLNWDFFMQITSLYNNNF